MYTSVDRYIDLALCKDVHAYISLSLCFVRGDLNLNHHAQPRARPAPCGVWVQHGGTVCADRPQPSRPTSRPWACR